MAYLFNITDHIIQEELSKNVLPATAKSLSQIVLHYAKPHAKKTFEYTKNFYGQRANSFGGNTPLEIIFRNALTIKNGYKLAARSAVSYNHIISGGNIMYPPFVLNISSASLNLISLGCKCLGHVRPIPVLTLLGDICSVTGDVLDRLNKGQGTTRPGFNELFL